MFDRTTIRLGMAHILVVLTFQAKNAGRGADETCHAGVLAARRPSDVRETWDRYSAKVAATRRTASINRRSASVNRSTTRVDEE